VSVEFRGPLNGRLVVRASSSILPEVANNMLGEDDQRPVALQRDALGEIANVICGHVLPMIGGSDAVFHLAAPLHHGDDSARSRDGDRADATITVGVEAGRAEAALYLFAARGAESAHGSAAAA